MLKLGRVAKVKVLLLVLVYVFSIDLFGEGSISLVFVYPRNNNSRFEKNHSFSIIPQIYNFIPLIEK